MACKVEVAHVCRVHGIIRTERGVGHINAGDRRIVGTEAGNTLEGAYLTHGIRIGGYRIAYAVGAGHLPGSHSDEHGVRIFCAQTVYEDIERALEGLGIGIVVVTYRDLFVVVVFTALKHHDVGRVISHLLVSHDHGVVGGNIIGHRGTVFTVVRIVHTVDLTEKGRPYVIGVESVTGKIAVAEEVHGEALERGIFHCSSLFGNILVKRLFFHLRCADSSLLAGELDINGRVVGGSEAGALSGTEAKTDVFVVLGGHIEICNAFTVIGELRYLAFRLAAAAIVCALGVKHPLGVLHFPRRNNICCRRSKATVAV